MFELAFFVAVWTWSFSVFSELLRQNLAAETFFNTFRISPGPLGLQVFLKDDLGGPGVEEKKQRPRAGEMKWQTKFEEFSKKLGRDIQLRNNFATFTFFFSTTNSLTVK